MSKILVKCDGCKSEFQVNRTEEIPELATSITCNWCPICEDNAKDYYHEIFNYDEIEIKDHNQMKLL